MELASNSKDDVETEELPVRCDDLNVVDAVVVIEPSLRDCESSSSSSNRFVLCCDVVLFRRRMANDRVDDVNLSVLYRALEGQQCSQRERPVEVVGCSRNMVQ
jgi:hypothetical protein